MLRTNSEIIVVGIFFLFIQGCASIMQGSTQIITVGSAPSGATLTVNNFQRLKTPATVELSRKENHRLDFSMEGYHPEIVEIRSVTSAMVAGNIIAGGLVGYFVDQSTGAAFRLVPEVVQVSLRPLEPDLPKLSVSAEAIEPDVPKDPN